MQVEHHHPTATQQNQCCRCLWSVLRPGLRPTNVMPTIVMAVRPCRHACPDLISPDLPEGTLILIGDWHRRLVCRIVLTTLACGIYLHAVYVSVSELQVPIHKSCVGAGDSWCHSSSEGTTGASGSPSSHAASHNVRLSRHY